MICMQESHYEQTLSKWNGSFMLNINGQGYVFVKY